MRAKERRDSGQIDFFKARLDQIVDMGHPLAKLSGTIDWRFLEQRFGAVYSGKPGQPPLPTRLMAGLSILKHTHNLSDEELCARWLEVLRCLTRRRPEVANAQTNHPIDRLVCWLAKFSRSRFGRRAALASPPCDNDPVRLVASPGRHA
jgi:Transposase domain (DUF772)